MTRRPRNNPRISSERDREILRHLMRYRLTTPEVLHKLYFADSERNAVTKSPVGSARSSSWKAIRFTTATFISPSAGEARKRRAHVIRALVGLLLHAEGHVDKRAGETGPLVRPPNGDAKALQQFERDIGRIISAALRDAGPPR